MVKMDGRLAAIDIDIDIDIDIVMEIYTVIYNLACFRW